MLWLTSFAPSCYSLSAFIQGFCVPYMYVGEKDYYERQFATLKSFEEADSAVSADGVDEEDLEEQQQQERAMMISNYANILLLAFKVRFHVRFRLDCP